jgi:hypothetical protein
VAKASGTSVDRDGFGVVVDEHLVPEDFEIGHEADAMRPGGHAAGEIDHDGALKARGETCIVEDALPRAVGHFGFNVGRDGLDAGLPRGVERGGAEVVDVAGHEQLERGVRVDRTKVERERVQDWRSRRRALE